MCVKQDLELGFDSNFSFGLIRFLIMLLAMTVYIDSDLIIDVNSGINFVAVNYSAIRLTVFTSGAQ